MAREAASALVSESVAPVPALVGSHGQEVGLRALWWDQAPTTLTLWRLDFDAELVYAGDTGSTLATLPSARSTTVAGITLGTLRAPPIPRRPPP